MTKHTPAPWEIFTIASPAGRSSRIFAKVNDEDIAHIPKEWNQANAHLIAAAPELLEALKDLVKANSIRMGRSAVQLRMDLAIEAINKAEGK